MVFVAKYLGKSVQSWARIIIPLVKDAAECNRVEILRGVNVESMTRGDPQITRPRERHMGPRVCEYVHSCNKKCVRSGPREASLLSRLQLLHLHCQLDSIV